MLESCRDEGQRPEGRLALQDAGAGIVMSRIGLTSMKRGEKSFEQLDRRMVELRVTLFDAFTRALHLRRFVVWLQRRQPPTT